MKVLLPILSTLAFTTSVYAEKLSCHMTNHFGKNFPVSLVQQKEINEDESTEHYVASFSDEFKADIYYNAFQEGIYISFEDFKKEISLTSTGHVRAELRYTFEDGEYYIFCEET